ncbi:hypothetical protein [Aurantiacibacter spongiae]|uniref:DUF4168 domain-containing protein n=1 Tax=Aurantiacibacter spongiae TaxID=2488860 RepID=A0A3N5CR29_9SPHN|nr:hypothetical protein [Aurantiacibacter spongiae]RPF70796.1 hypothetical protein EG799_03550 [Aurantiacibacter spongiae]
MKTFAAIALAAVAPLALAAPVAAQETPAQAPPAADPSSVTDAEIAKFVTVVMQGKAMENDTTMTDQQKQAAMIQVIQDAGFELARFSAVAQAINASPELQQRAQAELVNQLGQAQG